MDSQEGRPLSLPFSGTTACGEGVPLSSPAIGAYFENLIPDSERILRRLRDRHRAISLSAFDMLTAISRDCAGAVQPLPAGESPGEVRDIEAKPLTEAGVAQVLRDATTSGPPGRQATQAFRLPSPARRKRPRC